MVVESIRQILKTCSSLDLLLDPAYVGDGKCEFMDKKIKVRVVAHLTWNTPRLIRTSKLSLSMGNSDNKDSNGKIDLPRHHTGSRRFGGDGFSHNKANPFNTIYPSVTNAPSANASSAFGLGSGAFASFGSAMTPRTPGTGPGFDFAPRANPDKDKAAEPFTNSPKSGSASTPSDDSNSAFSDHSLRSTWTLFYRPPTHKYSDYEKSTMKIANLSTVESFWTIYTHLKRPSLLPTVSDYHIFKEGIRPVWEDDANKRGGKWIIRLKKGVADRYWEDLLFAIIGDQFMEAGEEVCGAVLSVRSGEDVLSIWTKIDGGRNIKIRYCHKSLCRHNQH